MEHGNEELIGPSWDTPIAHHDIKEDNSKH